MYPQLYRLLLSTLILGSSFQAFSMEVLHHRDQAPVPAPIASTPSAPVAPQASVPTTPGQFDTYVLAMSYTKDFCAQKPGDASCTTENTDPLMTLHGLWPDRQDDPKNQYQLCGLSSNPLPYDWCSAGTDMKNQMGSTVFTELSDVMPGVRTCLYNHEWYVHGTCSGLSVSNYFANAADTAAKFEKLSHLNAFIQSHAGGNATLADLTAAIAADLGATNNTVKVMCRAANGVSYFSSIEVALDPQNLSAFPASSSFAQLKPYTGSDGKSHQDTGNCPAQIQLVK